MQSDEIVRGLSLQRCVPERWGIETRQSNRSRSIKIPTSRQPREGSGEHAEGACCVIVHESLAHVSVPETLTRPLSESDAYGVRPRRYEL